MDISGRINAVYQAHEHALNLYRQKAPAAHFDLLEASLSHLGSVLEELRVAYEELKQQNQALVDYRQQLEAERQRYQELFNLAPDGYLVTNATGIIQEANVAMSAMLQLSQAYLVGKPLLLFFPEPDRPIIHRILAQLNPNSPAPLRHQSWETQLLPRYVKVHSPPG